MASTDFGSASAGQGATCGTDLAWARTVTDHDNQLFQRHFVRRAAMNLGACLAAWSLLAIWTGSGALSRSIGAYDFERSMGGSVTDALEATLRAGGIGLAGFIGILFFLLLPASRSFGHLLEVSRRYTSIPFPTRREGMNVGPSTVRLEGETICLDYAQVRYRMHLRAYRPARRVGQIVMLPLKGFLYLHFVTDSAHDAKAWVRALRDARHRSSSEAWDLPAENEGWSAFDLDDRVAEGLLEAEEKRAGRSSHGSPDLIGTALSVFIAFSTALAAGVHLAKGSVEGFVPAAVVLLLAPILLENLKQVVLHLRSRRRGCRLLGLTHALDTGSGAVRADARGLEIARPQSRTQLGWGGVDSVTEREGWLLVMSGNRIIEILPPTAEIKSAMKGAGLIRRGGPWGADKEAVTWQFRSAA